MMKGYFITFEGTDGSGKTSVIKEVEKHFKSLGYQVLVTREPGGIRISEKIRDILLGREYPEMDSRTEALLFAASRRQHLVEKILPALEGNVVVLCDRYVDSSLVYQGIARGLGIDEVYEINRFAIENHLPDLTIFVDVTPEVAIARIFKNENREVNRLDLETRNFHDMTYQGYQTLLKKFPNRIVAINGDDTIENVSKAAINIIETKLSKLDGLK
ncbi:MAG: dTMP kinase [Tenericutes bacterium HGW-Tenericutes-1]|jgi:dTMP kinase|nr:MAG: dTMP kinase [Tenericutes bacterium HGW-Tenericutes-1]